MSEDLDARTARPLTTSLAIACGVVWLIASASARVLGIWLAVGGASVVLGVAVLVLDRAAVLRLLRPRARLVFLGVAAGWSMAAATYLLYPILARVFPFIPTDAGSLYASFRAPPPVIGVLALLPVILGEELVWRGVVQTALVRRLGPRGAVPVAALGYALAHAPLGSPLLVLVALACGMAWGALRTASGSLVPSLFAHLVWDVLVLLWLPVDAR